MDLFVKFAFFAGAFVLMEGVAWFTHKYIMHGILWAWHRDHHQRTNTGFFERNDLFFLVFSLPGIVLLYLGVDHGIDYLTWIGAGISCYGLAYFFVHDIFIHQRFKILRDSGNPYLLALRRAHKVHHKRLTREHGECFGMLWVPYRYFREARKPQQS